MSFRLDNSDSVAKREAARRPDGKFGTQEHAEAAGGTGALETVSTCGYEVLEAEYLEGNCWDVPDDIDLEHAVTVTVPVDRFVWWSCGPQDDLWCGCGQCPKEPKEAADGDYNHDCDGKRIAHYAARMLAGDEFPPIQVLHDPNGREWGGANHTLLVDDGFHRLSAARLAGITTIEADIYAADYDAALAELRPEIFYHGTPAVLRPGDTLLPATNERRVYDCSGNVVYLVTDQRSARQWGQFACEMLATDAPAHVYACMAPDARFQPHEDEPNQWVAPTATVMYEVTP